MLELARSEGVKSFVGGADMENYGSYKAMIKNGFDFVGYDEDGDYRYISDLSKREDFRQISYVRLACVKTITGHGTNGYIEAIDFLSKGK